MGARLIILSEGENGGKQTVSAPPFAERGSEIGNLEVAGSNPAPGTEIRQKNGSFETQANTDTHYFNLPSETSKESRYTFSKNGIPPKISVNWERFKEWLAKDHTERVCRDIVSYAQKYVKCLENMDLTEVSLCEAGKRRMILSSLSNLAKFLGVYDEWRSLIRKYDIKWITVGAKDKRIIDRITKKVNPDIIYDWVKRTKSEHPELNDFLDLMAISGMRLTEAVKSYNLIIQLSRQGKLGDYYDINNEVLEHYKFRELFLRKGKKALFSFVPKELIDRIISNEPLPSETIIGKRVKEARFSDLREAHASLMTKYLNTSEIDFLQGRIGTSVFMQNYFNPKLIADLKQRIFKAIAEIQTKIS